MVTGGEHLTIPLPLTVKAKSDDRVAAVVMGVRKVGLGTDIV